MSQVFDPTAADVQAIFNRIAPVYDDLNQQLSLGLHQVWKAMAVRWSGAAPGHRCLDICCGSGDLALLLARRVGPKGHVYGIDFAPEQLAIARLRYRAAAVTWCLGDALDLPFATASFDAITMGYGLRNLANMGQGLRELRRVLKPGAIAAILDFHRPQSNQVQQWQQWYLHHIVIPAARRHGLTQEYAYITPSLDRFPQGPEQIELAQQAGFQRVNHYPIAAGMMGVLVLS
ncbi:MAG: bifunctional demethylmenaquinone methyltransferase/2-methoxy-6-polyprenyl-1,4-benzoquinol methylase UbiE [Nodosilinea sp.]